MNKYFLKFIFITIFFILSACKGEDESDADADARTIFPSLLEDERCFSRVSSNGTDYYTRTFRFDADGFLNFGHTYFIDKDCTNLIYQDDGIWSFYSYSIGEKVLNADGSTGTQLLMPDPENAGPYGTVFSVVGDCLYFAENTLIIAESGLSFTSTDNDGDFTGLEIDYEHCLVIRYE